MIDSGQDPEHIQDQGSDQRAVNTLIGVYPLDAIGSGLTPLIGVARTHETAAGSLAEEQLNDHRTVRHRNVGACSRTPARAALATAAARAQATTLVRGDTDPNYEVFLRDYRR